MADGGGAVPSPGFAIAPSLIATLSLVEQSVPAARLTEGMAFVHTGLAAGLAPGAALSGVVVDAAGASPAYLVSPGPAVIAALAAQTLPGRAAIWSWARANLGPSLKRPCRCFLLPDRAQPSRRPAVQPDGVRGAAADLHRHPRHRAAGHRPGRLLRARRRLSATYTIANGLCSVVQGRVLDHLGQSRVLPVVATVFALGIGGLIWVVEAGGPIIVAYLCAALAGAAYPPIGSAVRARWSFVLAGRPVEVQTAYALESVIDEMIFIVGPTIATVLATQWHPGRRWGSAWWPACSAPWRWRCNAAPSRSRSAPSPTRARARRCPGSRWSRSRPSRSPSGRCSRPPR